MLKLCVDLAVVLSDSCVLLTLRIGQNVNTLWNNPIQVCIAYFNTPPCYAYHTLPIATVVFWMCD